MLLVTALSTASLLVSEAPARAEIPVDALLEKAKALQGKKGSEQEMIKLANQVLAIEQSVDAYFYRAYAKSALGDKHGAISDYNQAIGINPKDAAAYANRGTEKYALGDKRGAIDDYNEAISISPQNANPWGSRGLVKSELGDRIGACEDMRKSASLGSTYAQSLLSIICQ